MNGRIREVATYPILVMFMLGVLSVVLVGFTIPRFLPVYERLNAQIELPLPTRIVMGASTFMRTYWPVIRHRRHRGAVSLQAVGTDAGRRGAAVASVAAHPIVGELLRKIALSRFAHYFATLHSSGLEVAPSLALIGRLIGNAYLSQQFDRPCSG